jgi:hypothetical protein
MRFFDDLALGSVYHRAICADTYLRIEPTDSSPCGNEAFALIVEAARKAAELNSFKFSSMFDVDSGRWQWARIEFPDPELAVRKQVLHR